VSDKLQKKVPNSLKENTQYVLAFGLIATMLLVAGFPMFVIFFFGIFAYFLWKTFSQPSRNETREIFGFYLSANEILRDDERKWFGFEVQEVIGRGERILQLINGAPPLVYFTLGALYNKIGDHKSAVNHLAYIIENENADEATYVYPTPELRNYVKILRKIEREPAEAPDTSSAVRALERARRNRGKALLENSRIALKEINRKRREATLEQKKHKEIAEKNGSSAVLPDNLNKTTENIIQTGKSFLDTTNLTNENGGNKQKEKHGKSKDDLFANRKPISEVLHDIYDRK
jgi:CHASE3 domain sensor protein